MSLVNFSNLSNPSPLIFEQTTSYVPYINPKNNSKISLRKSVLYSGSIRIGNSFSSYKGLSIVALGAKNSGPREGDKRALETVLKLYGAIRNRNTSELSDIIGEECRCVCNFIAAYQPCHGKQQVLEFFTTLMKNLGKNIQFKVETTSHDGMNVGISWKLEWSKNSVPIGKGFSFYVCHVYRGKVMIRFDPSGEVIETNLTVISKNVEMFMEPLFHIEPLRLKMIGFMTNVIDKIVTNAAYEMKLKRTMCFLLVLPLVITLLFFASLLSY